MLTLPALAKARGKRAVPNLRRDAERWARTGRTAAIRLPVTVHIATVDGDQVTSLARVERWVQRANVELQPYGIEVEVVAVRALSERYRAVTRWRERRELARRAASDGSIHVFVIDELDTARRRAYRRRIRGLHWRYRGLNRALRNREYVVVTDGAPTTTLAHEFGHLFGLRHSAQVDNIMCSCREGSSVSFTPVQGQSMNAGARRFVDRHGTSPAYASSRRR